MADSAEKNVLIFPITTSKTQARPDLQNIFIARYLPEILSKSAEDTAYFHYIRRAPGRDNPYGDSIWLRFKAKPEKVQSLSDEVFRHLKSLEAERVVEQAWDPMIQSDQEVFGPAPGLGPTSAYGTLWCFLDSISRTAINLLSLSHEGRLDVPEWVVADIWVDFFYNAMGIPDFISCPSCGEHAMRLPRCHACGEDLKPLRETANHIQ